MLMGLQELGIKYVRHEKWLRTEMRLKLNRDKVRQYAKEKKLGARFPAPVVFLDPEGIYWTGDGFHRVEADHLNGLTKIEVVVRHGTVKDAVMYNLRANRDSQGLPFGRGDLSKACKFCLQNKPFKDWTFVKIAETVGCHVALVSNVARKIGRPKTRIGPPKDTAHWELIAQKIAEGRTKREVAAELGLSERTIYRHEVSSQFTKCPHCNGSGQVLKESIEANGKV
jgi:hypothetical protein